MVIQKINTINSKEPLEDEEEPMAHLNDHFSFFKYKLVQSKECFPKGGILGERFFWKYGDGAGTMV